MKYLRLEPNIILVNCNSPENEEHRVLVKELWIEIFRIIYGIDELIHYGIVHHDLKFQNILYHETSKRANMIDFNLVKEMKTKIGRAHV